MQDSRAIFNPTHKKLLLGEVINVEIHKAGIAYTSKKSTDKQVNNNR
jgi:hypothetical protein